jgi:hypothetical protein
MTTLKFTSDPPRDVEPIFMEITGEYGGGHPQAGEPWFEQFQLITEMPAGLEAHYLMTATPGRKTTRFEAGVIIAFIALLIQGEENKERFQGLCANPEKIIRLELLTEIMFAAVEAINGVPTGPASNSSDGQPETTTGSEAESGSPEETPTD